MNWLVGLSPWLQLPILLVITLPLATVAAWAGLWLVDRVGANRSSVDGADGTTAASATADGATVVDHG